MGRAWRDNLSFVVYNIDVGAVVVGIFARPTD